MRNIVVARAAVQTAISDWEELRIKDALGHHLKRSSRIVLTRPWWMPGRFYLWLLGTIAAEPAPVK